jgi:hypothetical protein
MSHLTPPNAGTADGTLRAPAARSPAKPLPWPQDQPVIAAVSDRTGMPRSAQGTQIAEYFLLDQRRFAALPRAQIALFSSGVVRSKSRHSLVEWSSGRQAITSCDKAGFDSDPAAAQVRFPIRPAGYCRASD